ncbi:hypothetical protein [Actinomadura oligospora]|uniref:hypothetical protein n=1 Tax=Actinomadura oligospora TaxID=111804 RepID=UPI000554684D|nr:hypothetical protein [Actinomadura oligospora]
MREAKQEWINALRPLEKRTYRDGRAKPSTRDEQRAAVQGARAAIVEWMSRSPDIREGLEQVGEPFRRNRNEGGKRAVQETPEFIKTHVVPALKKKFGPDRLEQFQRRAVETHFWCELLAQTARVLCEFKEGYTEAKDAVTTALTTASETLPDWALILPFKDMIEASVGLVWDQLPRAVTGLAPKDIFQLIWPVRILALFMCKDPSAHRAVRLYCLNPAVRWGKAAVSEEIKNRLRLAFPEEWPLPGDTV